MKRIQLSTILTVLALLSPLASISPAKALPPGVPNRRCSEISNPRPGTLCYVLHDNQGGRSDRRGGGTKRGDLTIQPQAGYYVVDSTVRENISQAGNGTVNTRVLGVGAPVEFLEGYQSRITEIDRVINELEARIAVGAGPAVAEARNKLTYLRERSAEYAAYYQTAVSASRSAPTTQFTWSASPRRCGWLNRDWCGSWVNFKVYEIRRYLGDPIAEYNALLVPAINQARDAVAKVEQSPAPPPDNNACFTVSAQQGWQYFNLPGSFKRITSIEGSWSVDDRSYARVGAYGHTGDASNRLAPYNQYKYDQNYPFGALLVNIPNYGYFWVENPQQLPRSINFTAMRINDGDNALGDNGGSLRVCFGN
jgi:hypothetical protein